MFFTSAYVLITLVIKIYMCPGDLISAKLCRYHKATKCILKMSELFEKKPRNKNK